MCLFGSQKRPIEISRQAKVIGLCPQNLCDGIDFVYLTNSSLCFTSIVMILPRGRKAASSGMLDKDL